LAQPSRLTSHVYPHHDLIHKTPPATTHPMVAASTVAAPPLCRHSFSPLCHQPSSPLALLPNCPSLRAPTPHIALLPSCPSLCAATPRSTSAATPYSNQKSSELLVGVMCQPAELKPMGMGMLVAVGAAWFPLALPFSNLFCC
jgi:hypothetical protein